MYVMYNDEIPEGNGSYPYEKGHTKGEYDCEFVIILGTKTAERQGCNWGMQMIDGCSLELCVATLPVASSGTAPHI